MITNHTESEFETQIETMLEKVFRIIHEGMILHEHLTDNEYATLAITLKNINPPLRGLRISQCLEQPLSTYALTQLLQDNHSMEWFHLEGNKIDATGLTAIADILKQNHKLQQLYCGFLVNGITVEDIRALSDMLMNNTTLKDLNLFANRIDAEKTKIIAETLAKNPTLEKLGLASNEVGVEGATALADALTKNTRLLELNLSDCRLSNDGLKAIFSALKQNTALQTFTLRRVHTDVMPMFADMLAQNKTLKKLDVALYTSELSVDHVQILLQALRENKSLQELNIQDDDGKLKAEINEIQMLLHTNQTTPPAAAETAEAEAPKEKEDPKKAADAKAKK